MPNQPTKGRCGCKKRDGSPCPNTPREGKSACWVHDPELEEVRAEGRRQGGVNRCKPVTTLSPDTPDLVLKTVADVMELLAQTLNQVRTGRLAANVGNCLFVGAGVLLKAIEGGDLEQRLAALEAGQRGPGRRAG